MALHCLGEIRRRCTRRSTVQAVRNDLAEEGICKAAPFRSPVYSTEELVAKFGAAFPRGQER
jgi:hypothetical protein